MNYREWLKKQNEAIREMNRYWELAAMIPNKSNRRKYLQSAKRDFTSKWSQKFYEAKKN